MIADPARSWSFTVRMGWRCATTTCFSAIFSATETLRRRIRADHLLQVIPEEAVTSHVAQNVNGRRSAIEGRITRHPGLVVSQRKRAGRGQDNGRAAQDVIADCPRSLPTPTDQPGCG